MDVETMAAMRRRRAVTGRSAWTTAQYQGYRNWQSMLSHSDSAPYVTTSTTNSSSNYPNGAQNV